MAGKDNDVEWPETEKTKERKRKLSAALAAHALKKRAGNGESFRSAFKQPQLTSEEWVEAEADARYELVSRQPSSADDYDYLIVNELAVRAAAQTGTDGLTVLRKSESGQYEHPTARLFRLGIESIRTEKPSGTFLMLLELIADAAEMRTDDVLTDAFSRVLRMGVKGIRDAKQNEMFLALIEHFAEIAEAHRYDVLTSVFPEEVGTVTARDLETAQVHGDIVSEWMTQLRSATFVESKPSEEDDSATSRRNIADQLNILVASVEDRGLGGGESKRKTVLRALKDAGLDYPARKPRKL